MSAIYAEAGVWSLVTAAAIGIDDVQFHGKLELQGEMRKALEDAERELFPAAKSARYLHVHAPATLSFDSAGSREPLRFDRMPRGGEFRPRFAREAARMAISLLPTRRPSTAS